MTGEGRSLRLEDLARLRREYEAGGLDEHDVPADPMQLFAQWLSDAAQAELPEVNAMAVSTIGPDGAPSSRLVLCKAVDERGFVFFTNFESRKARDLDHEPRTTLLFPWHALGRQVRVDGVAAHVDPAESTAYFAGRPRGAQISAWASHQSAPVADRATLEQAMREAEARYGDQDVPRPPHWGGIRVVPASIEFWQGRRDRLHDRIVYRRDADGGWSVVRLQP